MKFVTRDIFSKAKPVDICNFYNNVESVYDHLIKRNNCYRIDARYENLISSGADKKVFVLKMELRREQFILRETILWKPFATVPWI